MQRSFLMLIGRLLYKTYYQPLSWLKQVKKSGGMINYLEIESEKKGMVNASIQIRVPRVEQHSFSVYFLTGKKYWPLTAFCMGTLAKTTGNIIQAVFVDDGSFDDALTKQVHNQFPGSIIKRADEVDEKITQLLPPSKYPFIHKKRKIYPHIRKLTDVHVGSTGWKMVLDSDMLFFNYPAQLVNWLTNPQQPFFLHDPLCSYHYSFNLMEQLTGKSLMPNLNVGAVGLQSEAIDWDKLEHWIGIMEQREGSSYLLEQALSAMLSAGQNPIVANEKDYIVMPDEQAVLHPTAVMHHYVADSKEWYYKFAWKAAL